MEKTFVAAICKLYDYVSSCYSEFSSVQFGTLKFSWLIAFDVQCDERKFYSSMVRVLLNLS